MHWPGASILVILGFTFSIFAMIVYLIARYTDKEKNKLASHGFYMYLFAVVAALGVFKGSESSKYVLNGILDINNKIDQSNKVLSIINPLVLNTEYQRISAKAVELVNQIEQNKNDLIEISGGVDQNGRLIGKDNVDITMQYFLVENAGENGEKFKRLINELYEDYSTILPVEQIACSKATDAPDTDNPDILVSWISFNFEWLPLSHCVATLTAIQNNILSTNQNLLIKGIK